MNPVRELRPSALALAASAHLFCPVALAVAGPVAEALVHRLDLDSVRRGAILDIAFSPDGRLLARAGQEGPIHSVSGSSDAPAVNDILHSVNSGTGGISAGGSSTAAASTGSAATSETNTGSASSGVTTGGAP